MKQSLSALSIVVLAGCTTPPWQGVIGVPPEGAAPTPATLDLAPPPPTNAVTADQFDTTSAEQRAAATAPQTAASETPLGTTIASLGSPADPGIWLKTPLVTELMGGRVTHQGNTINIALRPSGGAAGAGSQISLAAMRLLQVPLTSLPELTVFALP